VLFGEDGSDEANQRWAVGEDADDVGAASDLAVESFLRVVDQIWRQIGFGSW
jgi:hypothetical protein